MNSHSRSGECSLYQCAFCNNSNLRMLVIREGDTSCVIVHYIISRPFCRNSWLSPGDLCWSDLEPSDTNKNCVESNTAAGWTLGCWNAEVKSTTIGHYIVDIIMFQAQKERRDEWMISSLPHLEQLWIVYADLCYTPHAASPEPSIVFLHL